MNRAAMRRGIPVGIAERIKRRVPEMAITTDIIIRFPGETEDDFLRTLYLVEGYQV